MPGAEAVIVTNQNFEVAMFGKSKIAAIMMSGIVSRSVFCIASKKMFIIFTKCENYTKVVYKRDCRFISAGIRSYQKESLLWRKQCE